MIGNNLNAWREILTRVFEGFAERRGVTPEWLVNPDTNRRLKLDVLYAEIGVAIRFAGLQAARRPRRLSLEEESQQQIRDTARAQLCQEHGISLVAIEVMSADPGPILQELRVALSEASRRLAQGRRPHQQKAALIEGVSQARGRLEDIARRVRRIEDLRIFAALWQDRQFIMATPDPPAAATSSASIDYAAGMAVRHSAFGDGAVVAVQKDATPLQRPPCEDRGLSQGTTAGHLITVCFQDGATRTFAANLLGDKMSKRS